MLYKLEKVSKIYKNFDTENHALNKIDLEINEGEIVVILGPSGSGKSTMLNILSGIDNPTKGKVYFNNERIDKLKEKELTNYRKDNLGFIFQSYNLVPNLTIKENIELGRELSKNPLDLKEIVKEVGLISHMNKYPYGLSGGQMQRVAIARALVKNPKVLFCDEPTGALDEKTGKNVLKLLQDINKKYNTTMIIVTHNPSIANMANTVIKMNSGEIKEIIKNKTIMDAEDLRWA
ncbi:MAG: ABC transporter ATP-binding protein [Bacilli bacterium]|nr:ABC transporter ATP-binding protein [Bacilli bacterium]